MNILVVEDSPERIESFKQLLTEGSRYYTDDANLAIRFLDSHKFDLIFLDNDLGPKETNGEGLDVVDFICANDQKFAHTKIIIHSWNIPARSMMVNKLCRTSIFYTVVPFDVQQLEFYCNGLIKSIKGTKNGKT